MPNTSEGGGAADIAAPIKTPIQIPMGLPMELPMELPMGLAWLVDSGEGRVELNCNCNPASSRRKPTATASEVGVM